MNANRIKIACFTDMGTEFAREFKGADAIERAVGYFLAQMSGAEWERVRNQFLTAAQNAGRVGVLRPEA